MMGPIVNKQDNSVNRVINKYYTYCAIVASVYIVLIIWLSILLGQKLSYLLPLIVLVLTVPYKICIRRIGILTLEPVLFDELDANKYYEIINDKRFAPPMPNIVAAAWQVGDYQTVVNICNKSLKEKSDFRTKNFLYNYLSRAYFELRDTESLQQVCRNWELFIESDVKGNSECGKEFSKMKEFYKKFAMSEYSSCKNILKLIKKDTNSHRKYHQLNSDFVHGVVCYEAGENDVAREIFQSIIDGAPKLNISNLAKQYLDGMDKKSRLSITKIIPQEDYVIPGQKKLKQLRIIKSVLWAIVLFLVFLLLLK